MHYQPNKAGLWIGFLISLPLLGFSGWRDWDLLAAVLPASQIIAAFFGLAALDGGFLGWGIGFMKAKGNDQRMIAGMLCVLCFLGTAIGMVLDLVMNVANKGDIAANRSDLYLGAIILIAVAVIVNVGGGFLYALSDPKSRQDMRDQKAHDTINDLADAQIAQNAAMYAPQFAQAKVTIWLQQAQMIHGLSQPLQTQLPPPTVQGTGYALPAGSQPSLPTPTQNQQPPVDQNQPSLLDKAMHKLGWQKPVQPPTPVPPVQPPSTPVQSFSHTDALEQLYNDNPQAFAEMVEAIRQKSQQSSSPLSQPHLPTQANQAGTNGNGHQKSQA